MPPKLMPKLNSVAKPDYKFGVPDSTRLITDAPECVNVSYSSDICVAAIKKTF